MAQELVETERSYVFQLGLIVQVRYAVVGSQQPAGEWWLSRVWGAMPAQQYLNPLRLAVDNKKEIITPADIKNIFGGIEVIYQYNSALLKVCAPFFCSTAVSAEARTAPTHAWLGQTLEQRVAQWSDAQTLADIFSEMVTFPSSSSLPSPSPSPWVAFMQSNQKSFA